LGVVAHAANVPLLSVAAIFWMSWRGHAQRKGSGICGGKSENDARRSGGGAKRVERYVQEKSNRRA
jgi:hypothetical protein